MKYKTKNVCYMLNSWDFIYMGCPEAPEITWVKNGAEYHICVTTLNVE